MSRLSALHDHGEPHYAVEQEINLLRGEIKEVARAFAALRGDVDRLTAELEAQGRTVDRLQARAAADTWADLGGRREREDGTVAVTCDCGWTVPAESAVHAGDLGSAHQAAHDADAAYHHWYRVTVDDTAHNPATAEQGPPPRQTVTVHCEYCGWKQDAAGSEQTAALIRTAHVEAHKSDGVRHPDWRIDVDVDVPDPTDLRGGPGDGTGLGDDQGEAW